MSPIPAETLAKVRANIKNAEEALVDLKAEISKARLAGIDVSDQQKNAEDLSRRIKQLKTVYGTK